MKITKIKQERAICELSGVKREISIALLPSAKLGDFVLVHAGFAIQKMSAKDAEEITKTWKEYDAVDKLQY